MAQMNLSEGDYEKYEHSIKQYRDALVINEFSFDEGVAKGYAETLAKGYAEAIRNMLEAGMPLDQVAKVMKMPLDEVKKLLEN